MADNYLERQYELYRARKAAWEKAQKYGKKSSAKPRPVAKKASSTEDVPEERK